MIPTVMLLLTLDDSCHGGAIRGKVLLGDGLELDHATIGRYAEDVGHEGLNQSGVPLVHGRAHL